MRLGRRNKACDRANSRVSVRPPRASKEGQARTEATGLTTLPSRRLQHGRHDHAKLLLLGPPLSLNLLLGLLLASGSSSAGAFSHAGGKSAAGGPASSAALGLELGESSGADLGCWHSQRTRKSGGRGCQSVRVIRRGAERAEEDADKCRRLRPWLVA